MIERHMIGPDMALAEGVEELVRIRILQERPNGNRGIFVIGANLAFLSEVDKMKRRPHTRSRLYDTVLPVTYHLIKGGKVQAEKYTAGIPVMVKSIDKITTPLRTSECPALSPSGVVMKLLQEDTIGGNQKSAYLRSPFLLFGMDIVQIMEKIEGDTLEKVTAEANAKIQEKLQNGRSIDDEVSLLIETLRKSFEMDAELVQHLTMHQQMIPLVDGRGGLIDPGTEKEYLKNLLWGAPTEHAEQGYFPIMLERARKYGLASSSDVESLLDLKDQVMSTRGMRRVKRIIHQTERRKHHRKKILPHGDLEPGNIILGYETSLVWPGLNIKERGAKGYRPIDFGRTRYSNLGKDAVSLFTDPAYRPLWDLPNPERFGFAGAREEFNNAIRNAVEGIAPEYALDEQSSEDWNASLFLHAASRGAKRICRLRNEGLEDSLEETLASEQATKERLALTRSICDYSTFFLQACKELNIFGVYAPRFMGIFESMLDQDQAMITELTESSRQRVAR